MANTNGMRHPMTALEDGTFGDMDIVKGRVFDALTLDTVKKLKEMGVAAVGDLTEHQDMSITSGRLQGSPASAADVAAGEDSDRPQGTGVAGVNNPPDTPELLKTNTQANADAAQNAPLVDAVLAAGGGKDPAVIGEAAPAAADKVEGAGKVEGDTPAPTEFTQTPEQAADAPKVDAPVEDAPKAPVVKRAKATNTGA